MTTPVELRDVFTDPGLARDPLPWVKAMQARGPVVTEDFHNSIVVTGYDEVNDVYTRPVNGGRIPGQWGGVKAGH
jgi:hypothetical protein